MVFSTIKGTLILIKDDTAVVLLLRCCMLWCRCGVVVMLHAVVSLL